MIVWFVLMANGSRLTTDGYMMFDPHRYYGPLAVAAGLWCALLLCNAVLQLSLGQSPGMFADPDRQLAWSQFEHVGGQVSGVELQVLHGGDGGVPSFGVVMGQSTTLRGIDPTILNKQVKPRKRWLLLNGFGSSFVKLNYYAKALIVSRLRPQQIVLGLHETMLAGQDRRNDPADLMDLDAADELDPASDDATGDDVRGDGYWKPVKQLFTARWVRKQRLNVSHFTQMGLFDLRLGLQSPLGAGAVGLFPPSKRPWRNAMRDELPERHEARRKRQRTGWREFGWFDAKSYDTQGRQADAFRSLVAGCDALTPDRIIIVQLPITSDLRGWLPPAADDVMRQLIDEVSVGRPVSVIDLRGAMPDEYFADYAHLNPRGREIFSAMLAQRLNALNTPR